ncbi:DNA-directed RNA polymerase 3 largest subunit, putative [Plasmodium berghei]|uniref:DNA-directed RNA polymerase subunit n=2 Tax=Plasmodium berghei TaxID=5821 RepID=A0A509AXN1_PLABA|nr:DNA-directed RNA polymerase III subunit RPC1, putative [Plasmodium berghei ANKA]CXI99849.1 DNA-directed RNA polymerase 3 largest subunit, putative [Plasmodium berghei]SCL97920.1 DNA-directed RNA polymerase 3 largest subunit, putative [Plasmodium berghei]SCM16713.1 DNA-directed RNA polymerase 3 largest subunit, putative [Plasmodium berghei]SCN27944.1 DNA-directed RNA polymerase 3 largest subunit, putative [Plasmodium berghei]VUC57827.1 DNA-directed RNA polymerase III subunit RPC1, putative [|eukprot:XP_034423597.1 DNA-directed RNA polymerase III subunit RPC1, putative [Plasmodium berghei ANKA]
MANNIKIDELKTLIHHKSMKKNFVKDVKNNYEIKSINFGIMGKEDIIRYSEVKILNREMYKNNSNGVPYPYGVLDLRLGAHKSNSICETCKKKLINCSGHFGYIELNYPVFHIGYYKYIIHILYCICKTCSHLLLPLEKIEFFSNLKKKKNIDDSLFKRQFFKRILSICKKVNKCYNCGSPQGVIKKIIKPSLDQFMKLKHIVKVKENGKQVIKEEDLNSLYVLKLFKNINPFYIKLLNIENPEKLIITTLIVPPNTIRPSVIIDEHGTAEDDLTCILSEIAQLNNTINNQSYNGYQTNQFLGNIEFLQLQVTRFINSDSPAVSQLLATQNISKPGRGICQRLKGKEGRFRCNLSGKRVDFSSRTVISPDPNISIDEVVIPKIIAMRLTYPETVNKYNIEKLKMLIRNGSNVWPGANYIIKKNVSMNCDENGKVGNSIIDIVKRYVNKSTELNINHEQNQNSSNNNLGANRISLKYANKKYVIDNLKIGDIVERHICDGDIVLFNRQPSLHRMSIMCHKARVMDYKTFRFNECVCSPYNADFDGDEMNLHVPQTEESRAEALYLMNVKHNLITPKNGEVIIALTQDFLSASYVITNKDTFLDRDLFCLLCSYFSDAKIDIELPVPAILKPKELWTGKQLISVLIKPNKSENTIINFEMKEREYSTKNGDLKYLSRDDSYVCFYKSELICGSLGKKVLGASKYGLFYYLIHNNSTQIALQIMNRFSKLSSRYFSNKGMTIGIDDVTPSRVLTDKKRDLLLNGYEKVNKEIILYNEKKMQIQPGCTLEETLEIKVKSILDDLRNDAGKTCNQYLPYLNKPLIMFNSGAKGALINIAQMIACVGQQNVSGQRIQNGFINRTLPHFNFHCKGSESRGFVQNSFYTGLNPTEFFFHTMSGREGLVDTAVKTAETGYMQRRLMKALEDLSIHYDYSVRSCDKQIIQFIYGDDALNPSYIDSNHTYMDQFDKIYNHIISISPSHTLFLYKPRKIKQYDLLKNSKEIEKDNYIINDSDDKKGYNNDFLNSFGSIPFSENFQKNSSFLSKIINKISQKIKEINEDSVLIPLEHDVEFVGKILGENGDEINEKREQTNKQRQGETKIVLSQENYESEINKLEIIKLKSEENQTILPSNKVKEIAYHLNQYRNVVECINILKKKVYIKNNDINSSGIICLNETELKYLNSKYNKMSKNIRKKIEIVNNIYKKEKKKINRIKEKLKDDYFYPSMDDSTFIKQLMRIVTKENSEIDDITTITNKGILSKIHLYKEGNNKNNISFNQYIQNNFNFNKNIKNEYIDIFDKVNECELLYENKCYKQMIKNIIAFVSVFEIVCDVKQHYILFPYEILKWTNFLLNYVTETIPLNIYCHTNISKRENPTHQKNTKTMKIYIEEIKKWLLLKAINIYKFFKYKKGVELIKKNDYYNFVKGNDKCNFYDSSYRSMIYDYSFINLKQLYIFIYFNISKYFKYISSPGDAVGSISAQSIGEPGTQMTLKTFHFAGVASMNVTLGVPRIKEIINASNVIQTPILNIPLRIKDNYNFALMMKSKLEKTSIRDICEYIKENYCSKGIFISIKFNEDLIQKLFLNINAYTIRDVILKQTHISKIKINKIHIDVINNYKLHISIKNDEFIFFQIESLKKGLLDLLVYGDKDIKRCIIKKEEIEVTDDEELEENHDNDLDNKINSFINNTQNIFDNIKIKQANDCNETLLENHISSSDAVHDGNVNNNIVDKIFKEKEQNINVEHVMDTLNSQLKNNDNYAKRLEKEKVKTEKITINHHSGNNTIFCGGNSKNDEQMIDLNTANLDNLKFDEINVENIINDKIEIYDEDYYDTSNDLKEKNNYYQKKQKKKKTQYSILVEGNALNYILGLEGVDFKHIISNHVINVFQVLGIEAARVTIINEIKKCIEAYSIDIDIRHIMLLADIMAFTGEILGINRFGIQKARQSTLMLASFEETNEHLFVSSFFKNNDEINNISESIIVGKNIPIGTGSFELLYDYKQPNEQRNLTLLERAERELKSN